jgi:hypothetical protein
MRARCRGPTHTDRSVPSEGRVRGGNPQTYGISCAPGTQRCTAPRSPSTHSDLAAGSIPASGGFPLGSPVLIAYGRVGGRHGGSYRNSPSHNEDIMPNEDRTNGRPDDRQPESERGGKQPSQGEEVPLCMLPVPSLHAAWIQFCLARDLATWPPDRPSRLTKRDALVFCQFLHDALPEKLRTPVEGRRRRPKR